MRSRSDLPMPAAYLLWMVAQHMYGWTHCCNVGGRVRRFQSAEALERRGLVTIDRGRRYPVCTATDAGMEEIRHRWPNSPAVLRSYDEPKGGWDLFNKPSLARSASQDGETR